MFYSSMVNSWRRGTLTKDDVAEKEEVGGKDEGITQTTYSISKDHSHIKTQIPLITGRFFSLSLCFICSGKQPEAASCVKRWSIIIPPGFICHSITAMTDTAPDSKCFHLYFHVAKEQRSLGPPARLSKVGWQIFISWCKVTSNQCWRPAVEEPRLLEHAYLSTVINEPSEEPLWLHYALV